MLDIMKMTDSIIEEPENVAVNVSKPKRKKKNRDKIVDDSASLDIESSSPGERLKVHNGEKDELSTPSTSKKKKKKKHENVDEDGAEKGDTEWYNTSVIENESFVALHKKKKKKKKGSIDEAQTDIVYGDIEECNTSMVEDERSGVPHKKKKKKKKTEDFDESIDEAQLNVVNEENRDTCTEGYNTSIIEDERSGVPHKKKKKKKKTQDFDESIDEAQLNVVNEVNGDTCTEGYNTSIIEDERSGVPPKKKKKEKVNFEESVEEENGDIEGFNAAVEEANVKSSTKKKKRKLDNTEEGRDNTVVVNCVSVNEMEDKNGRQLEGEKKKERKKKKNKRKEMEDDEKDPSSVNDTVEEETTKTMQESGFTMINEVRGIKKQKVERVLPEWLSNPTVVSMNLSDGVPIADLKGVDQYFLKWLKREKMRTFFPVQTAVIPELLTSSKSISMRYRPRDICVAAPTGSGKTLAYVLPIIQALRSRVVPQLRALVILPTRELAIQVHSVFVKFTRKSKLKVCLAVGSKNFKKEQEELVFQDTIGDCAADILVATPGKLSDHLSFTDRLTFKYLRFLVMDEADLFLSSSGGNFMVKIEQLKKTIQRPTPDNSIISGGFQPSGPSHLPEPYLQQILVSATLMHDPEQLKVLNLHRPKLFIASNNTEASGTLDMVGPYMRPQEIREEYVIVDSTLKPLVLHHLVTTNRLKRVLVFTKSTMATHTLSIVLSALSKDCKVAQFSSKDRGNRKKILEDFSSKKINVLVSSDAMARGIDISNIEQVVSYDVPSVQTYVHRIGRTGRAGKQGFALTLVEDTPESKGDLKAILTSCGDRLHKIHVSQNQLTKYGVDYQEALATLKETTLKEKKMQKLNKIKKKREHAQRLKEKKKKLNRETT